MSRKTKKRLRQGVCASMLLLLLLLVLSAGRGRGGSGGGRHAKPRDTQAPPLK